MDQVYPCTENQHSRTRELLCGSICVLVCSFADYDKSTASFAIALLFSVFCYFKYGSSISYGYPGRVFICVVLLWCALGGVYAWEHAAYDVFKDVWYFLAPLVYAFFGFSLRRSGVSLKSMLIFVVLAGSVSSVGLVLEAVLNPSVLSGAAVEIREGLGRGYISSAVSIISLIGLFRLGSLRFSWGAVFLVLNLSAVYLSFSRSIWLVLVFGVVCMFGVLDRRPLLKIVFFVALGVLFVFLLRLFIDVDDPSSRVTFFGKVATLFEEGGMQTNMSFQEINLNWRGYESAMAFEQFKEVGLLKQLFGQGFGSFVDVGVYIALGDSDTFYRYVPVLHNGYFYAATKCGALGVLLLGFLYFMVLKYSFVNARENNFVLVSKNILMLVFFCYLQSTWSIAGIFNKSSIVIVSVLGAYCLAMVSSFVVKRPV